MAGGIWPERNGLQSCLFCLCQPLLIWSLQYQRVRWDISLWYPPACPTGPIKSRKTQFTSFTLFFFFRHPALLFSSSQDSVFHSFPPHFSLSSSLQISLSNSRPLTGNWRGSSGFYSMLHTVYGPIFVSRYTWWSGLGGSIYSYLLQCKTVLRCTKWSLQHRDNDWEAWIRSSCSL